MPNLYNLPDITFAERDPAVISSGMLGRYEKKYYDLTKQSVSLERADPRRIMLLTVADAITLLRNDIDYTGKQNLAAFATGAFLEHICLRRRVFRIPAQFASTKMRFILSVAQPGVTLIPAGTRATPNGRGIYFITTDNLEIQAGQLTGNIQAIAMESGVQANGFLAGQINRLVDPLPYVQSVENVTISGGGSDVESDENLRDRFILAPESYSTAGPRGAYIYWTRSASQLIIDADARRPSPGCVNLYPLLQGGEIPGEEILNRVREALDENTIRPMTDYVEAKPPKVVEYDLIGTWYLDRANAAMAASIETAVNTAVEEWVVWQKSALGRDINPDELIARVKNAGAKRLELKSPSFQRIDFETLDKTVAVGVAQNIQFTYGGMEDG